jgi:coniferyl-aldehyde dehydrogenase
MRRPADIGCSVDFGMDDERARQVLDGTVSGGVTINDVMTHMCVEDTLSHARAIYRQSEAKEAVALLHAPYGGVLRQFLSAVPAG